MGIIVIALLRFLISPIVMNINVVPCLALTSMCESDEELFWFLVSPMGINDNVGVRWKGSSLGSLYRLWGWMSIRFLASPSISRAGSSLGSLSRLWTRMSIRFPASPMGINVNVCTSRAGSSSGSLSHMNDTIPLVIVEEEALTSMGFFVSNISTSVHVWISRAGSYSGSLPRL